MLTAAPGMCSHIRRNKRSQLCTKMQNFYHFFICEWKALFQVPVYFSNNLQPIATRGKKAHGTLLVDIVCSSKRAPLSVSYYNEISGGHIGSCYCSEEGLCRPGTAPVGDAVPLGC